MKVYVENIITDLFHVSNTPSVGLTFTTSTRTLSANSRTTFTGVSGITVTTSVSSNPQVVTVSGNNLLTLIQQLSTMVLAISAQL